MCIRDRHHPGRWTTPDTGGRPWGRHSEEQPPGNPDRARYRPPPVDPQSFSSGYRLRRSVSGNGHRCLRGGARRTIPARRLPGPRDRARGLWILLWITPRRPFNTPSPDPLLEREGPCGSTALGVSVNQRSNPQFTSRLGKTTPAWRTSPGVAAVTSTSCVTPRSPESTD